MAIMCLSLFWLTTIAGSVWFFLQRGEKLDGRGGGGKPSP